MLFILAKDWILHALCIISWSGHCTFEGLFLHIGWLNFNAVHLGRRLDPACCMSVLDNGTAWSQPKQLLFIQRSWRHDHVWHQLQSLVNTVEGDCEQALLNVYLYEALHFVLIDNHNSVCFTFFVCDCVGVKWIWKSWIKQSCCSKRIQKNKGHWNLFYMIRF